MTEDLRVPLIQALSALPLALKIQATLLVLTGISAAMYGGFVVGSEYNRYIVGLKEIELFMVRNELAEARRTLDVVGNTTDDVSQERNENDQLIEDSPTQEAATPAVSNIREAGFVCLSGQMRELGFYQGDIVSSSTPALRSATEQYRNYMVGVDPEWRSPPVDDVNVTQWCADVADAFRLTNSHYAKYESWVDSQ